jgi:hypothetical protein
MNPKIAFGSDFLFLMRSLQLSASDYTRIDPISDAVARFFLITWGLSAKEADEANTQFLSKAQSGKLGNFQECIERIVNHVKKDRLSLERLVVQCAAIATLDYDVTPDEASFVRMFQDYFDLKLSEWEALVNQGANWAIGLNFLGNAYAEEGSK